MARALTCFLLALGVAPVLAAEYRTDWEGAPRITHVKMLRDEYHLEWWAWVTIDHEDWPIESRLFVLDEHVEYPRHKEPWEFERAHDKWGEPPTREFPHPYTHFVNWWVVVGPHDEVIHKRYIEHPHPGGWPYQLLEKGIHLPLGVTQVVFKAHDKLHGYGPQTVTVDILKKSGPGFEVEVMKLPQIRQAGGTVRKWMRSNLSKELNGTNW
jgi:hypothetical protein